MLQTKNISASYRETVVLEEVSFQVEEGEFLGIIGPNGAGKTTLLKIMTGVKSPLTGEVMLDGKDMRSLSRKQIAQIMAVVPQSSFIPPLFTVEDVVMMGRYPHQRSRFTITKEDNEVVKDVIQKIGITLFGSRFINELSGGERQEVIIARALAQKPKVLMLDEPTASLDIKHQMKILGLVKMLVKEDGITAIMVIHDLNLAARFCQRLILLHNCKIHSHGKPEDVLTSQNLKEVYEVDAEVNYNTSIDSLQIVVKE